jgi:hypothetical protein
MKPIVAQEYPAMKRTDAFGAANHRKSNSWELTSLEM